MKKVCIEKAGGYEQLHLKDFPEPEPQEHEVKIQVAFSGVNYADCLVRLGVYESAKRFVGWPITPGFEVSGTVIKTGAAVRSVKVGDPVIGFTLFGGYASHICIPQTQVLALPKNLSMTEGAAILAVFMTAYYALEQNVRLYPSSKILVHSAAGGVGSMAVQVAKALGHQVCAVVGSSHKVDFVKNLGADLVLDKSHPDFSWNHCRRLHADGFDMVLDANGYTTLRISYDLLRPTGKLVAYGSHSLIPKSGGRLNYLRAGLGLLRTPKFNPLNLVSDNKSIIAFNLSFLFSEEARLQEALNKMLQMLEHGHIQPPTVQAFLATNVVEAHQRLESGMSVGKLVLDWNHI